MNSLKILELKKALPDCSWCLSSIRTTPLSLPETLHWGIYRPRWSGTLIPRWAFRYDRTTCRTVWAPQEETSQSWHFQILHTGRAWLTQRDIFVVRENLVPLFSGFSDCSATEHFCQLWAQSGLILRRSFCSNVSGKVELTPLPGQSRKYSLVAATNPPCASEIIIQGAVSPRCLSPHRKSIHVSVDSLDML